MNAILLTGFSSGLGKSIHELLLVEKPGFKLIFLGRVKVDVPQYKNTVYIKADLENISPAALELLSLSLENVSELTFINNAAVVNPICNLKNFDIKLLEKAVAINFISPVVLLKTIKNHVERINIINVISGAANKPVPYWGAYSATKAAAQMFLNVVGLEKNINVMDFDPGVIDTAMQSNIRQSSKEFPELAGFEKLYKKGELRMPSEVAIEIIRLIK